MVDEESEAPPSTSEPAQPTPEPAQPTRGRVTLAETEQADNEAPPLFSVPAQPTPELKRPTRGRVTLADLRQADNEEGTTLVQKQMNSLKRASMITDFLKEQAMLIEVQDSAEKRQQKVEDKRQKQEDDELKARHEHAQAKALFRSLETLAEAAADCFFRSGPEEAAYLLQVAIMEAEEEGEPVDAPAPALAIAKAGARILLCTALSQAGAHSDALEAARDAADIIDEVLPALSEDRELSDGEESDRSSMASLYEEEVEDTHFEVRNARRLRILERAVELAVQARQCQSLELEFSAARAAQVAVMEPAETSEGDISPAEIAAGLRAEISELHKEGPELARRYLPKGNIVRIAAEKAFCEWQVRSVSITDGSVPPVDPKALRTALAMIRPRKYASRPAVDGLSLTKHERLYHGIPPLIDLQAERRRRRAEKSGSVQLGASSSMPSLDALDEFTKTRSAKEEESLPSGLLQSAATLNFEIGKQESWGKHSVHLGDLYSRSTIGKRELPKSSNNWQSVRRSPVSFTIHGPAGKASWALRKEVRRKQNLQDGQKINAFEDWRRNASGPKLNVKDQVLQTDGGINWFKTDMKNQSKKFKNFWLKEEVSQDELWQDRTFYGTEGVRLLRKSQPPRQPAAHTNEAAALFYYYNVPSPACPETVAATHTQLAGYGKLLDKSGSYMKKILPHKRGDRGDSKRPSKDQNQFAELKELKGLFKL